MIKEEEQSTSIQVCHRQFVQTLGLLQTVCVLRLSGNELGPEAADTLAARLTGDTDTTGLTHWSQSCALCVSTVFLN